MAVSVWSQNISSPLERQYIKFFQGNGDNVNINMGGSDKSRFPVVHMEKTYRFLLITTALLTKKNVTMQL